jgi:hypothetical protein
VETAEKKHPSGVQAFFGAQFARARAPLGALGIRFVAAIRLIAALGVLRQSRGVGLGAACALAAVFAPGTTLAEDGDEPLDSAALETTVTGRVMTGFEYDLEKPTTEQGGVRTEEYGFFVHQARFQLAAELDERYSIELSADLSDGLTPKVSAFDMNRPQYVRDAFVEARFSREFRLRAGHFKRPFSRLATTSAAKLPIRGRGLLDGLLIEDARWGDRALGAMVWGRIRRPELQWHVAVMNPNWSPTGQNNGYDAIGRVLFEPWKWLELGLNGARKSVALGTRDASGHAVGGDIRLNLGDLDLRMEGSYGDLVFDPEKPAAFGAHLLATYDVELSALTVLEPVLFAEYADAHSVFLQSESVRVVAGANVIHHDIFRVMPQVAFTRPLGNASEFNPWPERYEYYLMLALDL